MVYLAKGQLKLDLADGSFEVLVGGMGSALMPLGRGSKAPVSASIITDVELLHFDEDVIETVLTWNQVAAKHLADAGGNGEMDWRTMSGIFAVRNLTQGAFGALHRRISRPCSADSSGFARSGGKWSSARAILAISIT